MNLVTGEIRVLEMGKGFIQCLPFFPSVCAFYARVILFLQHFDPREQNGSV